MSIELERKELALRFKLVRRKKKLSLREAGKLCGLGHGTLCRIESGHYTKGSPRIWDRIKSFAESETPSLESRVERLEQLIAHLL